MKSVTIIPLSHPITAAVAIPGSLSYTIRALNLAAMTEGSVTIHNPLFSDDTEAMMDALETLGIGLTRSSEKVVVEGSVNDVLESDYTIDINLSGRTARSLLGLLCIVRGTKTVICKPGFKKRPVGELVNGLRQLGAQIEYLEKEGYLPLKILSENLTPGIITMKGSISSQFFSSIMMIAPFIGEVTIQIEGDQTSKPFIDVTIETMQQFGVSVKNSLYRTYTVAADQKYTATDFIVEADAIAAGYFWGIAALTGSTINVLNLPSQSRQGDIAFADVLEKMGCTVEKKLDSIVVSGPQKLHGITVDMNSMPDSAQTLAVIAAFAKGTTTITGLDNLRIKETDRIKAPETELKKMGVQTSSSHDTLTIEGGTPHGAVIETYGDHRMAMSFAITGTKIPGVSILDAAVVSKSFPTFWEVLRTLGISLQIHEQ